MTDALKILVIEEDPVRAALIEEGLRGAGYSRIEHIADAVNLLPRIEALGPDVILVDMEAPSRDVLEQMFDVSRRAKRPIAMFVDQSDRAMIDAAVDAGVGAYVVGGLRQDRIAPVLEMAISRFRAFEKMRAELDAAKTALADRKIIDRAKGLLMDKKGVGEEQAYALLRKAAMNENRRIAEVAQSVVTAAELGL